eukprot:gnl/MRDRNA2_/MRDRNA2_92431_c0_seq1.p1 gnl/MRDRNA2_/MRDRNA2_92431_c0~~gnl/MRDRNA2_/MRDRNA2_92431_c0_seq1.p1  ORF type:complete len:269 (+),score=82.88 gnl/MRDRNA2_/MRDRNA2_92431_c0_seq1:132-938(+)
MAHPQLRLWLFGLCISVACHLSRALVAQGSADDVDTDLSDSILLQGPPDPFEGTSANVDQDLVAAIPVSKKAMSSSKSTISKLSVDVDAMSDERGNDVVVQDNAVIGQKDLEGEGRRVLAAALKPSAAKERRARREQDQINSRHKFMADAGAFNVAEDEINRAKAESAASSVENAVASRRKAQKQAAYLLAVAEGYRKQAAEAEKNVEVVATKAARRAATQFRADHMKKAKLLEAKSWKSSQLASQTRATADALVQKAFAGLGNVQAS